MLPRMSRIESANVVGVIRGETGKPNEKEKPITPQLCISIRQTIYSF
jgi:hypothetical protein